MSDIFDHEIDAFESIMDTLEDSPDDLIEIRSKEEEDTSSPFYNYFRRFPNEWIKRNKKYETYGLGKS